MSRHHRLAHFKELHAKLGDWLEAGKTPIGIPGMTGRAFGVHVHYDGTNEKPVSWNQYKNRSVKEYFDTAPWAHLVLPYEGRYLMNWHRVRGHIGIDLNCPDDANKIAYSPVNGRVVYVSNDLNKRGFGRMVVIEEDMTQPSI